MSAPRYAVVFCCMAGGVTVGAYMLDQEKVALAPEGVSRAHGPPLPAVAAPSPPPAPPCERERCEERPRRLACSNWSDTYHACREWEIAYERHCACERWAPAPAGAP